MGEGSTCLYIYGVKMCVLVFNREIEDLKALKDFQDLLEIR